MHDPLHVARWRRAVTVVVSLATLMTEIAVLPPRPVGAAVESGAVASGQTVDGVAAANAATAPDAPIWFTQAEGPLLPVPQIEGLSTPNGSGDDVVIGDLNDDGIQDVVAARHADGFSHNALQIGLGTGGGQMAPPTDIYLGDTSSERVYLALGDVNGDDALDVLAAITTPNEIRIFYNDGAGGFTDTDETTDFLPLDDREPRSIGARDLDGDGDIDVVVLHTAAQQVTVFEQLDGQGTFDAGTVIGVDGTPNTMAIADTDGDGDLDISVAMVENGRRIQTLVYDDPNPDDGSLGDYTLRTDVLRVTGNARADDWFALWMVPDVTGDGVPDAAGVARFNNCPGESCFFIAEGAGDGTYDLSPYVDADGDLVDDGGRWASIGAFGDFGFYPRPEPPVDRDGDGDLDFVLGHGGSDINLVSADPVEGLTVEVLTSGDGAPPDQATSTASAARNDQRPIGAARFGDIDGDGIPDIVLTLGTGFAARTDGDLTWIRSDPGLPTGYRAGYQTGLGIETRDNFDDRQVADLADWDGDGTLDIVTFSDTLDLVYAAGNGDGTFADAAVVETNPFSDTDACNDNPGADAVDDVEVRDVDNDGHLDVLLSGSDQATRTTGSVCVMYGDGAGGIEPVDIDPDPGITDLRRMVGTIGLGQEAGLAQYVYADIDGDGDVDVVDRQRDDRNGSSFTTTTFTLYRNQAPERSFTAEEALKLDSPMLQPFALGDFDGANGPDLAFLGRVDASARELHVHRNDGAGAFDPTPTITDISATFGFQGWANASAGDIDADGDDDLIYSSDGGLQDALFESNGDGTFATPPPLLALTNRYAATRIFDIDLDGDPDLVSASFGLGFEVALNNGTGDISDGTRFDGPYKFSTSRIGLFRPLLGDLDGDGDIDMVSQYRAGASPPHNAFTISLQVDPPGATAGGNDPDLAVDSISTDPTSTVAGAPVQVDYTIRNGGGPASGSWTDAVYLSADDTWDIGDPRIAEIDHTGPLAAGATYGESVTVPAIPAVAGDNTVIVRTDVRRALAETDEANNTGAGSTSLDLSVALVDPTTTIDLAPGEIRYAQIPVGADETLRFSVLGPPDAADVDIVRDRIPRPARDIIIPADASTVRRANLPPGSAGTWFVRLEGRDGLDPGGSTLTLTAETLTFGLVDVAPRVVANNGPVTVTLTGVGLTNDTTATVGDGATTVDASEVDAAPDGRTLHATFDWGPLSDGGPDIAAGTYDVTVDDGDTADTLGDALQIIDRVNTSVPGTIGDTDNINPCSVTGETPTDSAQRDCTVFDVTVSSPTQVRHFGEGAGASGYIVFQNRALVDIPRPFLTLQTFGVKLTLDEGATYTVGTHEVEVPNQGARLDVLPAGAKGRIEFRILPTGQVSDEFFELHSDYVVRVATLAPYVYRPKKLTGAVSAIEQDFTGASREAVATAYLDQFGARYLTFDEAFERATTAPATSVLQP